MTLLQALLTLNISDLAKARIHRSLSGLCQEGRGTFLLWELIKGLPPGVLEGYLERGYMEIPVFLAYSPYLGRLLLKELELVSDPGSFERFRSQPFDAVSFEQGLDQALKEAGTDRKERLRLLRRFKDRALLKVAILDYNRSTGLERTMFYLSKIAKVLLEAALRLSREDLSLRMGYPKKKTPNGLGEEIAFCIMGLGKLGAMELNYQSDIDILFAYETDEGKTESGKTPHEFFTLMAKEILAYLGEYTEDGFVYRVDTRLRPEGTKGPLVNSLRSLEISYESWGQTWERLALSKMSPAAGDMAFGQQLVRALEPFIFRRTLDYTTIEDIGRIKARIDAEAPKKTGFLDLKLGAGGIREIEFIVQTLSVIHGGKNQRLRQKNTLLAVSALKAFNLLSGTDALRIKHAYTLLRRLEHALQLHEGLQTHTLPLKPEAFIPTARFSFQRISMDRILDLKNTLFEAMGAIHEVFLSIFAKPRPELQENLLEEAVVLALGSRTEGIEAFLRAKGFSDPQDALRRFALLRDGASRRPLTPRASGLLAQILPKAIDGVFRAPIPELALIHTEQFFAMIAGRVSYYALLKEHPKLLELLTGLFGSSSYLSHFILKNPTVLEALVLQDPSVPLDAESLEDMANQELSLADDFEGAMEALRSFKNTATLRIALLDLLFGLPLNEVLKLNSETAEICLVKTTQLCLKEMLKGKPYHKLPPEDIPFFVVATGSLGSKEMGYGSDIDMFFLFDEPENAKVESFITFITHLAQRILRGLTTSGLGGYLYRVDTRLRPRGRHGALVSSINRFAEFNRKEAGVFEKMSLFKARVIFGNPGIIEKRISPLLEELLFSKPLSKEELDEGRRLRSRMESELVDPKFHGERGFHLKWGKGGLLDVEFLVVWLILAFGAENFKLRGRSTIEGLRSIQESGLMPEEDAVFLKSYYLAMRNLENRLRLIHDIEVDNIDFEDPRIRELTATVLQTSSIRTARSAKGIKAQILMLAQRTRNLYDRYTDLLKQNLQQGKPDPQTWRLGL